MRYAYFVTCREVIKNAKGEVTELRCSYDPATRGGNASDGRKVKATIHWVAAAHSIPAEVRIYNPLFTQPDPSGDNFTAHLNPSSLEALTAARLEPALADARIEEPVQFERQGYFCLDRDFKARSPRVQPYDRTTRHLGQRESHRVSDQISGHNLKASHNRAGCTPTFKLGSFGLRASASAASHSLTAKLSRLLRKMESRPSGPRMASVWAIVRYQHIGLRRRNRQRLAPTSNAAPPKRNGCMFRVLAHVLSISGYHMSVVAGIVFFFIRAILSDRDSSLGRRVALWGVREVCGLLLASLVAGFATSRSTNAPETPPRVKRRRDRRLSRRTTNTCGTTQPACPGYAHGWAAGYGPRRRCWQVQARSKRRGGETALALLPRRR